jgi:hypothetical protein
MPAVTTKNNNGPRVRALCRRRARRSTVEVIAASSSAEEKRLGIEAPV